MKTKLLTSESHEIKFSKCEWNDTQINRTSVVDIAIRSNESNICHNIAAILVLQRHKGSRI